MHDKSKFNAKSCKLVISNYKLRQDGAISTMSSAYARMFRQRPAILQPTPEVATLLIRSYVCTYSRLNEELPKAQPVWTPPCLVPLLKWKPADWALRQRTKVSWLEYQKDSILIILQLTRSSNSFWNNFQ